MNIVVLMGGRSPEHEISLISGREVILNLPKKYRVFPVVISKDGNTWRYVTKNSIAMAENVLKIKGTKKDFRFVRSKKISPMEFIKKNADAVFIAMHGPFGEDGTVQGMLDLAGITYTGSGVLASALGMDKLMFRKVMLNAGIAVPNYMAVKRGQKLLNLNKLGDLPYFVKPHNQGSSVGNTIIKRKKDLGIALQKVFKFSEIALVDEFISGLEVTCGVMGNARPFALPLIEIHPNMEEFFDYKSKYFNKGAEEIVPARISERLSKKVQDIAIKVYSEIDCKGFSRVDFIIKNGKEPVVLEINTIPGLTPMSLLPRAAKAYGVTYSQLLDKIIKYAVEKN